MSSRSRYTQALSASGVYFGFQALRLAAGLVSMPVLTRALSKEDYGLLNLVLATVGILSLVGRLGFAEAMTRYYYERSQEGLSQLREFCSTMLGGTVVSSALVGLVTFAAVSWVQPQANTARCFQLAALVVVIRALLGVVYQIYRAQERPTAFSIAQIATRYVALALALGYVLYGDLTAYGVIIAIVVGEGIVAVVCLTEFAARGLIGRPSVSRWHFQAAFVYGVPLAIGTYSTFLLDYGDRFLIERFLGFDAVATYAVPYDLVATLAAALFGSLRLALLPVIFRLWDSDGSRATSDFVSQILTYSLAAAIPLGVLFVATSGDLIVFLTSAKYSGSAALTAYLLPGVFIGELTFLASTGLLVQHATVTLALLSLGSGALNVILNLILIPSWGLDGAALATTTSYTVLMLAAYLASRRFLSLHVDYTVLLKAVVATAVMLLVLESIGRRFQVPFVNLATRGSIGFVAAAISMSLLDREIRSRAWPPVLRFLKPTRSAI